MAKLKKITIEEILRPDINLDGDIDEVIDRLVKLRDDLKAKHPEYKKLEVEIDSGYESHSVVVCGTRLETDKERDERAKTSAEDRKLQRVQKLYQELKKMDEKDIKALMKKVKKD